MAKTDRDRAEMFSLLAGGLDREPEAPLPPEPVPVPEGKAAPAEVSESPPVPQVAPPVAVEPVESDASKQVNESTSKRKRRAKTGKRSDDAYMQTGMFLPVELVQEVKGYLAFNGNQQTIGDLTEGLLQVWADEQKAELAKRLSERSS